jgi:hypothetical protein
MSRTTKQSENISRLMLFPRDWPASLISCSRLAASARVAYSNRKSHDRDRIHPNHVTRSHPFCLFISAPINACNKSIPTIQERVGPPRPADADCSTGVGGGFHSHPSGRNSDSAFCLPSDNSSQQGCKGTLQLVVVGQKWFSVATAELQCVA